MRLFLAPNFKFEDILKPLTEAERKDKYLFFSFASPNADVGSHVNRISDINGAGIAFVYEDKLLTTGVPDYNDLIFQIGEVTGDAPIFKSIIDEESGEVPTISEEARNAMLSDPVTKLMLEHLDAQTTDEDAVWISAVIDCEADFLVYDDLGRVIGKEGGYIPGAVIRTYEENGKRYQVISWLSGVKLSDESIANLKASGVSEEIITKLKGVKDSDYELEDDFIADIESLIGKSETELYKAAILKEAKHDYTLTQESLENLTAEGLPQDIIDNLTGLKDMVFPTAVKFKNELKKAIGETEFTSHETAILKHAKGKYRVLLKILEYLKNEAVPDEIILKLRGMKNHTYISEDKFETDLKILIGTDQTLISLIMKNMERPYYLVQRTLDQLKANGIPSVVLTALEGLKNQEYLSESAFLNALNTLNVSIEEEHKALILQYAKDGKFRFVIQGSAEGTCTLTIKTYQGGVELFSETKTVEIEPHRSTVAEMTVTFDDFILTTKDPAKCIPHDFNGDGIVDIIDIMKVASKWTSCSNPLLCSKNYQDFDPFYDLDDDGEITVYDIRKVMKDFGKTAQ